MTVTNEQNLVSNSDAPLEASKNDSHKEAKNMANDQPDGREDDSAEVDQKVKHERDADAGEADQKMEHRGRFRNNRFGNFRRFGRFGTPPDEYRRRWEELQSKKPVIEQGKTGKVKWYSFRKNYGFIQRDDGEKDVFVHQLAIAKSRIRKPHLRTLANGEAVQFDVVQGKQGFEAVNVTGPSGKEVEGCRIIFVFDDFDRPPRYPRYYNNFNDRRPMYYNNYRRPGPGYLRERSYEGRDVGRYQSYRRYPGNRAGYRDEKFDRPPYRRQRRRRSYRPVDHPKEENAETKPTPANADDKADDKKTNKGPYKRRQRQYRRRTPKQPKEEGVTKDSEKSAKESSDNKEQPTADNHVERIEKSDANKDETEEIIKGVGDIVI